MRGVERTRNIRRTESKKSVLSRKDSKSSLGKRSKTLKKGGTCYLLRGNGAQWQLFGEIQKQLLQTGMWNKTRSTTTLAFNLLLADRGRVSWKNMTHAHAAGGAMVNYIKGYGNLTNKNDMLRTLVEYNAMEDIGLGDWLPAAFAVDRECPEYEVPFLEYWREREDACIDNNIWLAKPDRGAKGDNIKVAHDAIEILDFIEEARSNCWLIQKYIERPLLIYGRKFDIRMWVIVTGDFRVMLYREGVCRISNCQFSLENLNDRFVHLTNHCVQAEHPDYSNLIKGNEMFFEDFQSYLDDTDSGYSLDKHIIPQVETVVVQSLRSVRSALSLNRDYGAFQILGYDFMITNHFEIKLLEVNATPAVSAPLLSQCVTDFIETIIEPLFPGTIDTGHNRRGRTRSEDTSGSASPTRSRSSSLPVMSPRGPRAEKTNHGSTLLRRMNDRHRQLESERRQWEENLGEELGIQSDIPSHHEKNNYVGTNGLRRNQPREKKEQTRSSKLNKVARPKIQSQRGGSQQGGQTKDRNTSNRPRGNRKKQRGQNRPNRRDSDPKRLGGASNGWRLIYPPR